MAYISADTGLSVDEINEGLAALDELGFARYERTDEVIWVCEMAKWQLGELKGGDKRFIGVRKFFNSLPIGPFTQAFVDRYGRESASRCPWPRFHPAKQSPWQGHHKPSQALVSRKGITRASPALAYNEKA